VGCNQWKGGDRDGRRWGGGEGRKPGWSRVRGNYKSRVSSKVSSSVSPDLKKQILFFVLNFSLLFSGCVKPYRNPDFSQRKQFVFSLWFKQHLEQERKCRKDLIWLLWIICGKACFIWTRRTVELGQSVPSGLMVRTGAGERLITPGFVWLMIQ